MATTLGSLMTMPRSRTWTSVLAVPEIDPDVAGEQAEEGVKHQLMGSLSGARCGVGGPQT